MKKIWFFRLIGVFIVLLLVVDLPVNNIEANESEEDEGKSGGSGVNVTVWREAESWDRCVDYSASDELWQIINLNPTYHSGGLYTATDNNYTMGDYAEWDFTVFTPGLYHFYVRAFSKSTTSKSVLLFWNDTPIGDKNFSWFKPILEGGPGPNKWYWKYFGNHTLSEGDGVLRIKDNDTDGDVVIDNILITNTDFDPRDETDMGTGYMGNSSYSHFIGYNQITEETTGFDYDYIKNVTYNLSQIVKDSYGENELHKGRAFGTKGEIYACNELIIPWMEDIGLFKPGTDYKEQIKADNPLFNLDYLYTIDNKLEVEDMWINFYNQSSSEVISLEDFFISPQWGLQWNCEENEIYTGEFTYENITIEMLPSDSSEWIDFFRNRSDDINNTNFTGFVDFMNWTIEEFQGEYIFNFSDLTPCTAPDIFGDWWNETYIENVSSCGYNRSCDCTPFVFIAEDPTHNPDNNSLFPFINKNRTSFVKNAFVFLTKLLWAKGLNCKGLLLYDFNNDTYDMNYLPYSPLPTLYINGSIGNKINKSRNNYKISFYINQDWNTSVISYNVIGQIYGIDPSKTIIVSCLYDSWWNQGTADSAIGIGMMLSVAKWFKENHIVPKYNIKFIAFSGEEYGLRGAYYYEKEHRDDEDVILVIDLNQLGFNQTWPDSPLTLNVISSSESLNSTIVDITSRTNYEDRVGYNTKFRPITTSTWAPPSDYLPFLKANDLGWRSCDTVCFLKDTNWTLHHRDGLNHTAGDVMNYYYDTDVNVTAEMILNVTIYFAVDSIFFYNNWNLINMPLNNSWMASTLAENITGCQMISWFDAENQTYKTYIVGVPGYDFEIKDGYGLFILVNQSSIIRICGDIITSVSVPLRVGWNMIGWYHDYSSTASNLASSIAGCQMISWFDAENQTFKTHIVGVPGYDFDITKGMGIFVLTNVNSTWYGDDNGEGGESNGGQESEGGSAGAPYPIYGRAFYRNQSSPVENVNLTIINLNTNGTFDTTIPADSSGYYNEDLGQLSPSGWDNGDILRIIINGTGNYSGWTGQKDIALNTTIPGEHIPGIYLNPTNISLQMGWNLVTVPLNNSWNASNLIEIIPDCLSVSCWDVVNQTYRSYVAGGPSEFDFSIDDGIGYYVNVNQTSVLSWSDSGYPITNASMSYETGWNLLGWYNDCSINASSLADDINNSDILEPDQYVVSISKWNASNQTYHTYMVGSPTGSDFDIIKGMGIVVNISNSTGGGSGSNPGTPHTIWGYAYYLDSNIHADDANVVIRNKNTSEQIYTTVGESASGYYMQELSNLPSGWTDEDIITITVNSTSEDIYEGWAGYIEIAANNSLGNQKIQNIMVYGEDSTVIRYDNGSEESTVMLDNSTDEVLKTFEVDPEYLETASSAKLWIYAKADGEDLENSSHKITVNNDSKCVIFFDPIAMFGYSYCWQSFEIELDWLTSESNTFSVVDAYTNKNINDLLIGIDAENDCDMSQWKIISGSLPPADECEGELLMVLQLFF
jgi:hypothetical protein